MNAVRLFGHLVLDSRGTLRTRFSALVSAWFVASGLLAPANLGAGELVSSIFQSHIREPAQKAIIVYDQGREDLVLQTKYEGSAQEFGWLIPVPGLPMVRQGSMDCFYDLSRLTQEPLWPQGFDESSLYSSQSDASRIKPVEIKTSGSFGVEWFGPQDTNSLSGWLATHGFVLPQKDQSLLVSYITGGWYVVAIRINPMESGFALSTNPPRKSLTPAPDPKKPISVELAPLMISFSSEKCLYPLGLWTTQSNPSEIAVIVLSSEPLISRAIFENQFEAYRDERLQWIKNRPFREKAHYAGTNSGIIELDHKVAGAMPQNPNDDPTDPRPPPAVLLPLYGTSGPRGPFSESDEDFYGGGDLVRTREARSEELPACANALPRLAGKSWWVTRQTAAFAPEETRDLQLEPALPMFAEKLRTPEGRTLARWLPRFGTNAVPLLLARESSPDPAERRFAVSAMSQIADPRFVALMPRLLGEADARLRANACHAANTNWDSALAPRLVELLSDDDAQVRSAACNCLQFHAAESANYISTYRKMVDAGGVAASPAMSLLRHHRVELPKAALLPFLSSTDRCTIEMALWDLRDRTLEPDEISVLLTNSLPMARSRGLALLFGRALHTGDKVAIDRMVSMLRDPNEGLRWQVRQELRMLSGKKLGADPAAWEKWWAENRETFTPLTRPRSPFEKK